MESTDAIVTARTSRMPQTLDEIHRLIEHEVREHIASLETALAVTRHHRPLVERIAVLKVRSDMAQLWQAHYPEADNAAVRARLADELTDALAQLAVLPEADQLPAAKTRRSRRRA